MKILKYLSVLKGPILFLFMYISLYSDETINIKKPDSSDFCLFRLHYENSNGEEGMTTFDYDEKGLITIALWELLDGTRSSINFYSYDPDGNMFKKYREFSDSLRSTQTYSYDSRGYLTSEYYQRSDSIQGNITYNYNGNGKVKHAHCQGLNGWFFGDIYYTYNDDGQKISGQIEQDGKKVGTIVYVHNDLGHVEREVWDFFGTWSQTFIYEYKRYSSDMQKSYTSPNALLTYQHRFRIKKENYTFSNETGGPSRYEYGQGGKLLKKIFKRSDGLTTETWYLYDDRGFLIKSYRKYSRGLVAIFNYEYNKDRKMTLRSFQRSDGLTGTESYVYDCKGALVRAVYKNMDSWLTGTIIFTHHDDGRLYAGKFKGSDGLNADILFAYDEQRNPVKIHWEFSSGRSQTYTFDYGEIL